MGDMNYFAHGRRFTDDPYFLAGTAVPDWLNVVNRRVRARAKSASAFVADPDPQVAAIARGILRHHHDDAWFHQTRAFAELSLQFTLQVRDRLTNDDGFRPSFLGHILVELLLDATLIEEFPPRLDDYYRTLTQLDSVAVSDAVSRITARDVESLRVLIPRFVTERFLCDYLDDGKLLTRLNHVMRRVQLPALPESLSELFPGMRTAVRDRRDELLAGETTSSD
jgi:hypothetical protein